jgi:hypothetical protein
MTWLLAGTDAMAFLTKILMISKPGKTPLLRRETLALALAALAVWRPGASIPSLNTSLRA